MSTVLPRDDGARDLLRAIEKKDGLNVFACYQCGKCTAACPFSFSPQRLMRFLQLGQVDQALTMETPWVCASCMTCSRLCPKDANPAGVIQALKGVRSETDDEGSKELIDLATEQYRRHSHPLRAHFFANIHDISRRGSRLAPVSNWMAKAPGAKLVAHHILGVHKERPLPEFVRPPFPQWFENRELLGDGHRGHVALFHDTFMDFDAPQIGMDVTELLELAGFGVSLAHNVCCGRPMISKGYMREARERAMINVEQLYEQLETTESIVGCEPSCLLTVREEYPKMLAGTELETKARAVAERCFLIDEFLARPTRTEEIRFRTENSRPKVLFHGHCQQKAEADPDCSLELLRIAGYDAEMVAAPCCGMAGAFGFEREHYEASKKAFDRALGPALEANPDAMLVVMGISCRKQIEHFAGRQAIHLVEALRLAARDP